MVKSNIRSLIKKKLLEQSKEESISKSIKICEELLSLKEIKEANSIGFYLAKPTEVNLDYAIKQLINSKKVSVPVTNDTIEFSELDSLEGLHTGKFGIREPKIKKLIDYTPEVIVIPGVAFGLCKNRIGYGKGFYDSYLKNKKTFKIGVAFEFQISEKVPCESHDVQMDLILTEKRII